MRNKWTPEELFYILVRFLLCFFIMVCTILLIRQENGRDRMLQMIFIMGAMLNGLMGVRIWEEDKGISQILAVAAIVCFTFAFI